MRKLLLVCLVLLVASAVHAGDKVTVTWDCGTPDPAHTLPTGDKADHAFMIGKVQCKAVSGEIAGVKTDKGTGTEFHEIKGMDDTFKGVFVETLSNGDTISYSYKGTAKMTKEGGFAEAGNAWEAVSGTGKFAGIKSSGTCKAAPKAGGGATFTCTGEYTLKK